MGVRERKRTPPSFKETGLAAPPPTPIHRFFTEMTKWVNKNWATISIFNTYKRKCTFDLYTVKRWSSNRSKVKALVRGEGQKMLHAVWYASARWRFYARLLRNNNKQTSSPVNLQCLVQVLRARVLSCLASEFRLLSF